MVEGKIEALASVIEGTIITISGLFLLYQAASKAASGESASYVGISVVVMVISIIITLILVTYLNKIAKETNSMVIRADALHYKTDVYTNGAVLISLLLISFTGYEIIDVVVGGGISLFIIYSAYELIRDGVLILLDRSLDEKTVKNIEEIIVSEKNVTAYHMLKTREAGHQTFVDVHLVFDCLITLVDAHNSSDTIEGNIRKIDKTRDWIISIHLDPYDDSSLDENFN